MLSAPTFAQGQQLVSSSQADTWVATDALGRAVVTEARDGEIRKDKFVGIFYFVWQGAHGYDQHGGARPDEGVWPKAASDTISPYDITKLLAADPENPAYGPVHAFHYWGEPYFGYYLPDDEWIIRKHAQMLSDAGVDVLILDVTNAAIYQPQITKIAEVYRKLRSEGRSTPSLAFIVNSKPAQIVQRIYQDFYQSKVLGDLWFNWKGKPLLLCPPEAVTPEIAAAFTTRQSWAWSKDQKWFADGKDKWPWLDHTPQSYGWHEAPDNPEAISVAIAEHPMSNIGRSFHEGREPDKKEPGQGLYFAEQWRRALEVDPEFIFVTGWNEWVAMRFDNGASKFMIGKPIEKGETYFVDLYNAEYSRDAEPVKGDFGDNYYYQLVDNIRKFKGSRPLPAAMSGNQTISIDGSFADWKNVKSDFVDDADDTFHRQHAGWGRIKEYVNTSGRNDIVACKVTSDADYVYFYVRTAAALTPWDSPDWMRLFIGLPERQPAWSGFNYLVNRAPKNGTTTQLESFANGHWQNPESVNFRAKGQEMELRIPRRSLGINGNTFTLDFKWADNSATEGDPIYWLDQGDAAPNARFRYRYRKE